MRRSSLGIRSATKTSRDAPRREVCADLLPEGVLIDGFNRVHQLSDQVGRSAVARNRALLQAPSQLSDGPVRAPRWLRSRASGPPPRGEGGCQ